VKHLSEVLYCVLDAAIPDDCSLLRTDFVGSTVLKRPSPINSVRLMLFAAFTDILVRSPGSYLLGIGSGGGERTSFRYVITSTRRVRLAMSRAALCLLVFG
jgi:hypothetical protein